MKKNFENGITLVALVITIIVLVILAGVSINLVLGDNGIIQKAKLGKENYEVASEEEKDKLQSMTNLIDDIVTGDVVTTPPVKILSEEVAFTPSNSEWNVKTVKEALDYLYEN